MNIMKMNLKTYFTLAAATILAAGCAVEEDTASNRDEQTYLDAWLHVHYPDADYSGNGIYILEDTPGEGDVLGTSGYAFVTYTITDLEGNISATSDENTAKRLGGSFYNKSYYYGANVWPIASQYKGVMDMLSTMQVGGERTALVPRWLITYRYFDTPEEYIENITDGSHTIYNIKVWDRTDDITQWELDSLKSFSNLYLGGIDATSDGFYYKQLTAPKTEVDLHKDTTLYINYTGRLLNGQVFDTTIEDTAKVHNIHSTSATYSPVSITMSDEMESITMGDDASSIITGFAQTLWQMSGPMEKGVGMFYSNLGYGSSGSGSTIPAYAPLIFEIELVENPED